MTSSLPLPTAPSNPSDSLSSLTQTLDDLLERYLILLHQYQTLQAQLSQTLSSVRSIFFSLCPSKTHQNRYSQVRQRKKTCILTYQQGYLSLARANFQSTNRARYGQDFYDDRMQASTQM